MVHARHVALLLPWVVAAALTACGDNATTAGDAPLADASTAHAADAGGAAPDASAADASAEDAGGAAEGGSDAGDVDAGTRDAGDLDAGTQDAGAPAACDANDDCQGGELCVDHACRPGPGSPCAAAADCGTGFCADHVCCGSACDGACSRCDLAGTEGLCLPLAVGADPDGECPAGAASQCANQGGCDGAGACLAWGAGTPCGAASCGVGDKLAPASACDGAGACVAPAPVACAPYLCAPSGCTQGCASDADCALGATCSSGSCLQPTCPLLGLGQGGGVTHYVCDCQQAQGASKDCVPGDDANPGTDPAAPWRTVGKARGHFLGMPAGDAIAFCRGGAFVVDALAGSRWTNPSCLADKPCVVRDYPPPWQNGPLGRPIVTAVGGVHAFALEDGGPSDHDEGFIFMHLDVRSASGGGVGFFVYNDMDDALLCDVAIDGFAIGMQVAGSNAPNPGSDGKNARVTLRASTVTNNSSQGYLGGCDECAIEQSTFDNNGFAQAVFNHNIYFSSPNDLTTHGMRAVGNDLYRSAIVNGSCQGVSLVVHGAHDGLRIEGNHVHEDVGAASPGCWGIAVDTGYGTAEAFTGVVLRGNRVTNVGNMGIGLNACQDCVLEDNVVVQTQAFETNAIQVPDRARGANDLPLERAIVRNNSVLLGAAASGAGIRLGEEGSGHVEVSNAVEYLGASAVWRCFGLSLAPAAYAAVGHNLCHYPGSAAGEWAQGHGKLAAFQQSTGLDAGSTEAAPQFASVSAPAFDLRSASPASPLVDAGDLLHSALADLTGKPRDAKPDIGAYER